MINALIAFNSTQIDGFMDNFRFDANGDRLATDFDNYGELSPYNPANLSVNLQAEGMWKPRSEAGPATTILATMLVSDELNGEGKATMIEYLRSFFDGRFQVLGVWQQNGLPLGQSFDEEGVVVGNKTYPLHPQYLKWMPDDVVRDVDGNELSRTDATAFKQVNLYAGWKNRQE